MMSLRNCYTRIMRNAASVRCSLAVLVHLRCQKVYLMVNYYLGGTGLLTLGNLPTATSVAESFSANRLHVAETLPWR